MKYINTIYGVDYYYVISFILNILIRTNGLCQCIYHLFVCSLHVEQFALAIVNMLV